MAAIGPTRCIVADRRILPALQPLPGPGIPTASSHSIPASSPESLRLPRRKTSRPARSMNRRGLNSIASKTVGEERRRSSRAELSWRNLGTRRAAVFERANRQLEPRHLGERRRGNLGRSHRVRRCHWRPVFRATPVGRRCRSPVRIDKLRLLCSGVYLSHDHSSRFCWPVPPRSVRRGRSSSRSAGRRQSLPRPASDPVGCRLAGGSSRSPRRRSATHTPRRKIAPRRATRLAPARSR